MSDHHDGEELELEALQRQLDDAFETTRPRRGFEDELWLRMQRRRPFGERIRDMLGGLVGGFREAPAIPIATVALLLIVVVGVGVLGSDLSPFRPHTYSSTALAPNAGGADTKGSTYLGGQIPTPALHPGLVDSRLPMAASIPEGPEASRPMNVYYGPANLVWTGTFPTDSVAAPVLVYAEPSAAQRAAAISTGAGQGQLRIDTYGSVLQLPREPIFIATTQNSGVAGGTDPQAAADNFLTRYNLLPAWPDNIVVLQSGSQTRVVYQRAFTVQSGDLAYLVDWNGERYGTEVDIAGGGLTATGPLPLGLQSVSLPLIPNGDAAHLATTEPAASTQAISPTPSVNLDKVELVYALAISGQSGYFEPAYLFSGTFTYNGQTYVKRVLVPLVVASLRS